MVVLYGALYEGKLWYSCNDLFLAFSKIPSRRKKTVDRAKKIGGFYCY
jgi:hypothetical protein